MTGVLVLYLLIAAVYTHPLLGKSGSLIAADPGDPAFNAAILSWNAAVTPFSAAWWNAPHYYPTEDVAAFTENLAAISPISSPIIWATGNYVLAYNIAVFLTWPLSAWATYLLVLFLTRRQDAALLAGLAFGFSPYRIIELSHLQMLSTQWLPLVLLGLHGYLADRRKRWLGLFGISWVLASLSNGYFMLFGAVLIGLWLVYFGSKRVNWPAAGSIVAAWAVASLPIVPVLLRYKDVHERFGLYRTEAEVLAFSAQPSSWAHVSPDIWLWRLIIPDGKDDLFPGATALILVLLGVIFLLWRGRDRLTESSLWRSRVWIALAVATGLGTVATLVALCVGHWTIRVGDITLLRMTSLNRALTLIAVCGGTLVMMTRSTREALQRRSVFVFYTMAAVVVAALCVGPILKVGEEILLSPMPYRWLMGLPGFSELRVVSRFWMLGLLCLGTAAGLAYSHLRPLQTRKATAAFLAVAFCVLLDGWIPSVRMAEPPEAWPVAERSDSSTPILELPIGPDFDYAATYRAGLHRRRLVNGVSGYNPPYYIGLVEGLQNRDQQTLAALASRGPLDVVVNGPADAGGALQCFVSEFPGASRIGGDGRRVVYRIPQGPPEPTLGAPLRIMSIHARHNDTEALLMSDGKLGTSWVEYPQSPDAWVMADLGETREVGAVTLAVGDFFLEYPKRLLIYVSPDGSTFERVWDGATTGPLFLASIRAPRVNDMRFSFAPRQARFVRLRQVEKATTAWRISELQVYAPAR